MSRAIRLKLQLPWYLRLWHFFIWILFIALALVVCTAGSYWFLTLPRFRVTSVVLVGTTTVDRAALRQDITAYLATPSMGIAPRDTIFTLGKDDMASALQSDFPRLKTVDARWQGKTDLALTLTDRTAQYLWSGPSGRFLADEKSFVFARASSTTLGTLFELEGGIAGEPIGKTILTPDERMWIALLRTDLAPLGVMLTGATLEGEGDITFATDAAWLLKTNTAIDGQAIARSLRAVLRAQRERGETDSAVEYIDLRFPNKAYFRLRDAPLASTTPDHV